ncbi:MAG: hypothetical protein ACKVW3_09335, partial [Phycisphaerales bacterium]
PSPTPLPNSSPRASASPPPPRRPARPRADPSAPRPLVAATPAIFGPSRRRIVPSPAPLALVRLTGDLAGREFQHRFDGGPPHHVDRLIGQRPAADLPTQHLLASDDPVP